MKLLDRYPRASPPWSSLVKLVSTALTGASMFVVVVFDCAAMAIWSSLVERRDALAGTLLGVHASLLGFAVATFAIILSVRSEKTIQTLEQNFTYASRQMWDALNSASWATGAASLNALVVMVLAGGRFENWVQHMFTASLFATTFYVILTLVGVLAVVHSLVVMLRPDEANESKEGQTPAPASFQPLGWPGDDE